MKKFLSLVLALVMTMSLVTVSAGAKDFTDDSKINYEEAVAVMSDLKVLGGYTDGSFNPQGNLTRQAAAKIICNMILGPTTAAALRADTAPFKDVPATNEFAGYITYCAQQGIISGYADGEFKPGNPLTGYAFMKMLLGALGYDAQVEGYVGANWSVQVAKRAIGIGLNAGLKDSFNGVKTVNREEATLYAFNTLKATMVEYDTRTTVNVGGAEVIIAGSAAQDVANSGKETIKADRKLQFAEKYFTKLTLNDDTTDVFGRPANTWVNNKKEIGTYADYTLLVDSYTAAVKGNEIYDLLGASAVADNSLTVYVDGVDMTDDYAKQVARNYKKDFATTGNGVLTEVYMDVDNDEITVVEINTFLATVDDDYNEKKDSVSLTIQGAKKAAGAYVKSADDDANAVIKGEDFAIAEDLKADDIVLVTVAQGKVQSVSEPEVMEAVTISSFKKNDNYTVEGDVYSRADAGVYDGLLTLWTQGGNVNLKDRTYNVYLDEYGYVIGITVNEADDNYVFITAYDFNGSNLTAKSAEAFAIFTDGTTETIQVKKPIELGWKTTGEKTENQWYTYTVDKNDVYTLGVVARDHTSGKKSVAQFWNGSDNVVTHINDVDISIDIGSGHYAYGTSKTNYLVAELGKLNGQTVITGVESVITSVKNADLEAHDWKWADTQTGVSNSANNISAGDIITGGVYPLYNRTTGSIIACVVIGEDANTTDNLVYVTGDVSRESYDPAEDEFTWTQDALLNGKEIVLTEKGDTLNTTDGLGSTVANKWYKVTYKADGTVKKVDLVKYDTTGKYINSFDGFNKLTDIADKRDVALVLNGMNGTTRVGIDNYTLTLLDVAGGKNVGIDLAEDCNAVVVETWNNDDLRTETYSTVKSAVSALSSKQYKGWIYAVMTKGQATTVVFYDTVSQFDNETNTPTPNGKLTINKMTYDTIGKKFVLDVACTTGYDAGTDYKVTITNKDGDELVSKTSTAAGALGNTFVVDVEYEAVSGAGTYTVKLTVGDDVVVKNVVVA